MIRTILSVAAVLALVAGGAAPASAQTYFEWSTDNPRSGFYGGGLGRGTMYCDYIKYPERVCDYRRVCRRGKCYEKRKCRVVGYDIRQSCS